MSSNRLMYDNCQYNTVVQSNKNTLEYILYPSKYENCQKCRMQLGTVSGNQVSTIKGSQVDLESDLRGQTRPATQPGQCPSQLYQPYRTSTMSFQNPSTQKVRNVNLQKNHLPPFQMFPIKSVPEPPTPKFYSCPK